MSTDEARARRVITQFLARQKKPVEDLVDGTSLWSTGLDLDSLEAAELSATLEDELGTDPFSVGPELPETVGDIVAFYAAEPIS